MDNKSKPSQPQGSDREARLASVLKESGLLSPLLAASIAQVEQEAKGPAKTSTSGAEDSYVRSVIRARHPELSEEEISELEAVL